MIPIATPGARRAYFQSLEWLRFLLALFIAVFHTFHYEGTPAWISSILEQSYFATSTFFILSGFLLTYIYIKGPGECHGKLNDGRRSFWIKRLCNLYPIHVGALALVALAALFIHHFPVGDGDVTYSLRNVYFNLDDGAEPNITLSDSWFGVVWLSNLLLLHAWNPWFLSINIPSWSISALMFFYLLFPVIAPRLVIVNKLILAIILCNLIYLMVPTFGIITGASGSWFTGILHHNPLARMPEFIAGILLCSLYQRSQFTGYKLSSFSALLMGVVIICALVLCNLLMSHASWVGMTNKDIYYLVHSGALMPFQLMLIWMAIHTPNEWMGNAKLASRLGNASLCIFALHIPLNMVFVRVNKVLSGNPQQCLSDFSGCLLNAGQPSMAAYPLFVMLLVVLSVLFQERFVIPVRKFMIKKLTGTVTLAD
jgi:peptidoglycan/LPS O-acetylase OafA/YrhL